MPKSAEILSVFTALESKLRQFLMRYFVRNQDIDDAVQETFLRVYESSRKQEIRTPKAFIFKVAENLALSEISRKANQITHYMGDMEELEVIDNKPSMIEHLLNQEKLLNISKAIESLPPQCQKVVVMRKVFGFTHKEIASRLSISVKTVENHLTRGLQRCQEVYSAGLSDKPAGVDYIKSGQRVARSAGKDNE